MVNAFAILALAAGASATSFHSGAPPFTCPSTSPDTCCQQQGNGWSFDDISYGPLGSYSGFNFEGFSCGSSSNGKRGLNGRDNGKHIAGVASADKSSCPSISCDEKNVKTFSIDKIHIGVEYDCDLEFHYGMGDGSTCKQTSSCSSKGSIVQNTQCGGAKNVTVVQPSPPPGKSHCSISVSSVAFHCSHTTTIPSLSTSCTNTPPPATSHHVVPTTSSHRAAPTTSTYPAVPPTTSSIAVPTTSSSVAVPTTSSSVEVPTTSSSVAVPTTSSSVEVPTTSSSVEVPTTSSSVEVPTTSSSVEVPTTSSYVAVPTTSSSVEVPTTSSSVAVPTTSSSVEVPTTSSSVVVASSSTTDVSPTTTPAATSSVPETITTIVVDTTTTICPVTLTQTNSGSVTIVTTSSTSTVVSTRTSTYVGSTATSVSPVSSPVIISYSTSTVRSTVVQTITSCAPTVTDCPARTSPITTTVIVDVSTTICPVTATEVAGSSTAVSPVTASYSAPVSTNTPACPDVLPSCINTFVPLLTSCVNSTDSACYCPSANLTNTVYECLNAHGADAAEISAAQTFFQGICAPYVAGNPGIVTGATVTATASASPISGPATTLVVIATITVPCTDVSGSAIPGSSTVSVYTTSAVVPAVVFTTVGSSTALVAGTVPAVVYSTTLSPVGSTYVSGSGAKPTGPPQPAFTGAANQVVGAGALGLAGLVAAFML